MKLLRPLALAGMLTALACGSAQASLATFQTFVGSYGVSTDGFGSSAQAGTISAFVPAGATVTAAYLYTSTFAGTGGIGGTLGGTNVNYATLLGSTAGLEAARADVTSIVKPLIDGGPGGTYNFRVTETSQSQDGEALVVVYSLPSLSTSTVAILDGFSATTGDSTTLNFSAPIDKTIPGFQAEMRLGIGFSFDGSPCGASSSQTSRVTVNGTVITNNAGCNDDAVGVPDNGNLITVGGSDDPFSPLLPTIAQDHERYDLAAQIANGDTSIVVRTLNPSNDDNIFLAVFQVSGEARVNDAPEPTGLALVGLALLGLGAQRRMQARR